MSPRQTEDEVIIISLISTPWIACSHLQHFTIKINAKPSVF